MQITELRIRNFKSIRDMHIRDIENALILVGKNDTGKTAVLDAVRAVGGDYTVQEEDFRENFPNVEIQAVLQITDEDLKRFHRFGLVSSYRRYEAWYRDFCRNCPLLNREKSPAVCWLLSFPLTGRAGSVTVTDIRKTTAAFHRSFPIFILWIPREIWRSFRPTF